MENKVSIFKPDFDKEGAGVSKKDRGLPSFFRFFYVIGHRWWQVIVLNMLYFFLCIPIVTIGPATAGLTYVLRNYSQEKHAYMFDDFAEKCKQHFVKGLIVSIGQIFMVFLVFLSFNFWTRSGELYGMNFPPLVNTIALIVTFYFAYMALSTSLYIYPMMVSFDLPLKKIVRNSWILATYKPLRNIAMFLFNLLIVLLCWWLFPLSLPIILFLAFSICNLFNNFMIYPLLVKYVATPVEEKPVNEEDIVFKDRT